MEFQDVTRKRRMVRAFTPEPIAPEIVERLLRTANRAPSAGFSQGYALLVLEDAEDRAKFWSLLTVGDEGWEPQAALMAAPLIVVPLANKDVYLDRYARPDKGWDDRDEAHWPVPFWHIDTGFTVLLMLLASVDESLGALYFGIQPTATEPVREAFGVPAGYVPIGAVAIGHPDVEADAAMPTSAKTIKRRKLDDVVHRGAW